MKHYRVVNPEQLLDRLGIRYDHRGEMLWASCPHPEHNDRTPSWRIINDPEDKRYTQHRCYGCGFGGWPVHLVESVLNCSRYEAREWLRDVDTAPPLPFAVNVEYQRSLETLFVLPPGVKQTPLDTWPELPREYARSRGLTAWQVQRWRVGYADGRWDEILNPLAGRIVFAVRDHAGKPIGYTGRSYTNSKRRYKEPSKREGADLGAVFGEECWPKHRKVVVVTEGALDALAVERQYPAMPVAGIYGSELHQGHVNRLSTFGYVLMASDPDKAGNRVANVLAQQLRRWTNVLRVNLPEGEDCASVSVSALRSALDSCLSVVHGDRHRPVVEDGPRSRRRRTEVRAVRK